MQLVYNINVCIKAVKSNIASLRKLLTTNGKAESGKFPDENSILYSQNIKMHNKSLLAITHRFN